jgi:hypothetical protein
MVKYYTVTVNCSLQTTRAGTWEPGILAAGTGKCPAVRAYSKLFISEINWERVYIYVPYRKWRKSDGGGTSRLDDEGDDSSGEEGF